MQNERFWRWLKTVAVLLAITISGVNIGIFSPTFPDMALLTSVTNGQMATTMTWAGLASIVGALCMGPLFDRFDGLLVLAFALVFEGLAIGVAPWSRFLIVFQVMTGISAIFITGITAGSMAVSCLIWKEKPGMINTIIQVTNLFQSLGTALAPQLVEPFISKHQSPDATSHTATPQSPNVSSSFENIQFNTLANDSTTSNSSGSDTQGPEPVQIAYVIVASLDVLAAIVCFVVCALTRGQTKAKSNEYRVNQIVRNRSYSLNEDGRTIADEAYVNDPNRKRSGSLDQSILTKNSFHHPTKHRDQATPNVRTHTTLLEKQELQQMKEDLTRNDDNDVEAVDSTPQGVSKSVPPVTCSRKIIPFLIILVLFFALNGARDTMFNGLLYTVLNGYLNWTSHAGTLLVTFYHVTRVVTQVGFVALTRCLSPMVILVIDLIFFVVSSGLLLVGVMNVSHVLTGIAVLLTGVATSNVNPTTVTLAQRYFQVDGKVMGAFLGAAYIGVAIVSPIAGWLLDSYGAIGFAIVPLIVTVAGVVLFALWLVVAKVVGRRQVGPHPAEEIAIENEKTPLNHGRSQKSLQEGSKHTGRV